MYVRINQEAEADPSIHDEARAFFKKMEDGQSESLNYTHKRPYLELTTTMHLLPPRQATRKP